MRPTFLLSVFMFFFTFSSFAQDLEPKKNYPARSFQAKKITSTAPDIDGNLDDSCWAEMDFQSNFTQRSPNEGDAPSQQTGFKMFYDEKFVYFGFKCYDTEPEKIVKRLSRRDGFEGDWVEINIDSYNDKRTAFSFTITAAGVKGDEFISNNGDNWDSSWDPIWYARTKSDAEGWTAEIKIPLSQLRYNKDDVQSWGLQVQRRIFRLNERSVWQMIPQNSPQWVSSFGAIEGISGIKPQKQIEIQPYLVGKLDMYEAEEGNPYRTGRDPSVSAGLDAKIGITSDLTLDLTVNPDFGQVEADPSVLALDGYQIFFQERRPFFIENRNIFDFRLNTFGGGPGGQDNLFYSRRIGGAPKGYPELADGEYMKMPEQTTILAAAKFSGKIKSGLSIGVLETVTQKEVAEIDNNGDIREEVVEPLTNYFVTRVQQDFNEGATQIGAAFTSTNRKLEDTNLDWLHKSAYSGGVDVLHKWKDQSWWVAARATLSQVNGTTDAITATQTSHERYFQRPDAEYVEVDSSATSLTGYGGYLGIGNSEGNFRFMLMSTFRAPALDLNDLGFQRRADDLMSIGWCQYRITDPFSIFNSIYMNYNMWSGHDFGGDLLYYGGNINVHSNFKNQYSLSMGINWEPRAQSIAALRGGPTFQFENGLNYWFWGETDSRKKFRVSMDGGHYFGLDSENENFWGGLQFTYNPINTLEISVGPNYSKSHSPIQYIDQVDYQDETKYILGTIDQETFSMTMRLNYTIRPNMSIQYYGSPFISKGNYSNFKMVDDPVAKNFDDRFTTYSDHQIVYDNEEDVFWVDEQLDGVNDYDIYNPDFNFIQFRSNLVARWEYTPGSELFLVWSQGTTNNADPMAKLFPSLRSNLFDAGAQNIFLIKYTYRFLL